jgi:pimeloyl-ACP methyl ester carboxylesterase
MNGGEAMTMRARVAVLAGIAVGLLLVATAALLTVMRPLSVFETIERARLRRAGLTHLRADGPRGPQSFWQGGSGPMVVFLHGANDQAGTWVRVLGAVIGAHEVVLVDLAGHGGSAPSDGPLGTPDLLDGLDAVTAAIPGGAPVALVGNSLGGYLALVYAARHPERVSHVVLVNGAAIRGDGSEARVNLLPRTRDEARDALAATMSPSSPGVPSFVLDDLVRRAPASPLARLMRSPSAGESLLEGRLPDLRVPVTLLWGEDDQVLPLAYARRVAAALPAARLVTLARCGHVPQRECPGLLGPALGTALDDPPSAPEGATAVER